MPNHMIDQTAILAGFEARAKALDIKMYKVCEEAGLAPSTYYRWVEGTPANIDNLNAVDRALRTMEAVKAAA